VFICKLDYGVWLETKVKAPEMLVYTRWSPLMSWENRDCLPKRGATMFFDWDIIRLISWKRQIKNVLLQSITKVEIQPHVDKQPRASWAPLGYQSTN
jgi:hypothetical protein